MSAAAALAGWPVAGVAVVMWWLARRGFHARMEEVARAGHELRGPITAARLGLELGARGAALSAARLRAIDSELGRATLALEDLARVHGAGAASREHAMLDLDELLADSVEAWRASAAAAGIELRLSWVGPRTPVLGDRRRLAQATGNLISNAIEHGGALVEVRGCIHAAGARVEVVDDGPGLPAPVGELSRRARHGRGSRGRGLAIATGIARDHGGRLAAAPAQRGARLVLELPSAHAAPRGSGARELAAPHFT